MTIHSVSLKREKKNQNIQSTTNKSITNWCSSIPLMRYNLNKKNANKKISHTFSLISMLSRIKTNSNLLHIVFAHWTHFHEIIKEDKFISSDFCLQNKSHLCTQIDKQFCTKSKHSREKGKSFRLFLRKEIPFSNRTKTV